ncbi:hypothetical protein FRC17_005105 [Serendipita sp. 399]|nr:hypothetical protein FRC17_005105 [Serendipita sp. 399]
MASDAVVRQQLLNLDGLLVEAIGDGPRQLELFAERWAVIAASIATAKQTNSLSQDTLVLAKVVTHRIASIASAFARLEEVAQQPLSVEPLLNDDNPENKEDLSDDDSDYGGLLDEDEALEDDEEDPNPPNWPFLRDWLMENMGYPFVPTSSDVTPVLQHGNITLPMLRQWVDYVRKHSGWQNLFKEHADCNTNHMQDLWSETLKEIRTTSSHVSSTLPPHARDGLINMYQRVLHIFESDTSPWWDEAAALFLEAWLLPRNSFSADLEEWLSDEEEVVDVDSEFDLDEYRESLEEVVPLLPFGAMNLKHEPQFLEPEACVPNVDSPDRLGQSHSTQTCGTKRRFDDTLFPDSGDRSSRYDDPNITSLNPLTFGLSSSYDDDPLSVRRKRRKCFSSQQSLISTPSPATSTLSESSYSSQGSSNGSSSCLPTPLPIPPSPPRSSKISLPVSDRHDAPTQYTGGSALIHSNVFHCRVTEPEESSGLPCQSRSLRISPSPPIQPPIRSSLTHTERKRKWSTVDLDIPPELPIRLPGYQDLHQPRDILSITHNVTDSINDTSDNQFNLPNPPPCVPSEGTKIRDVKAGMSNATQVQVIPPVKKRRRNSQTGQSLLPPIVPSNRHELEHPPLSRSSFAPRSQPRRTKQLIGSGKSKGVYGQAAPKVRLQGWSNLIGHSGSPSTALHGENTQPPVDTQAVVHHEPRATEEAFTTSLLYTSPPSRIAKSVLQFDEENDLRTQPQSDWPYFDENFRPPPPSSAHIGRHPLPPALYSFNLQDDAPTPYTGEFADDATEYSSSTGTILHTPSPFPLVCDDPNASIDLGNDIDSKVPVPRRPNPQHYRDLEQDGLGRVLAEIIGFPVKSLGTDGAEEGHIWLGE